MKLNIKIGTLAAVGALVAAVPATAHPGNGNGGGQSHKCQSHNRAYVESGTVDSTTAATMVQNSDGTWTGTLTVDVTRANHAAKADKGQTVTYTFTSAQLNVRFDGGETAFAAGDRVKLIGKIAAAGKHCPAPTTPAAPVFKRVVVHPAASSDTSGSGTTDSGTDSSDA
jgi:hypothetical protein